MEKNVANYRYERVFELREEAMEVARYFHEVLQGNPDYIDNRILLNVEDNRVLLVEFWDSKTHLHVDEGSGKFPVLELLISFA